MGIEPNPGPRKVGRKVGRGHSKWDKQKRKKLSQIEKGELRMCFRLGLMNKPIATKLNLHPSTVSYWKTRFLTDYEMKRKAGSGPKRITTLAQDRALKYRSKRNRSATAVELQCEVKHKNGKDQVSVETVRRRLREAGLYGRIARRKPLLTAKHIEKRLEWAKKYKDWTPEDWEKSCVLRRKWFSIIC